MLGVPRVAVARQKEVGQALGLLLLVEMGGFLLLPGPCCFALALAGLLAFACFSRLLLFPGAAC